MGTPKLTSSERAEVYRLIFLLNRSFDFIVQHLDAIQKTGLFKSEVAKLFPSFTQELQAEFNQEFLEDLHQLELDDWGEYGKARHRYEKHLRDPDDVFIQAERTQKAACQAAQKDPSANESGGSAKFVSRPVGCQHSDNNYETR